MNFTRWRPTVWRVMSSCPMSDTQYQDFSDRSNHAGQRLAGAWIHSVMAGKRHVFENARSMWCHCYWLNQNFIASLWKANMGDGASKPPAAPNRNKKHEGIAIIGSLQGGEDIVKPQTRFLPWSLKCPRQGSFARSNTVEKNRIPLVSWVVSIPGSHCTILAGRHLMNQCQEIGDKYRKKKKKRDWLSWNSENALYARFTFLYALMSEINANWSSSS
jgi:hypothetical protein